MKESYAAYVTLLTKIGEARRSGHGARQRDKGGSQRQGAVRNRWKREEITGESDSPAKDGQKTAAIKSFAGQDARSVGAVLLQSTP